jgi:hypothetical protein
MACVLAGKALEDIIRMVNKKVSIRGKKEARRSKKNFAKCLIDEPYLGRSFSESFLWRGAQGIVG